jgi:hypothetical protein
MALASPDGNPSPRLGFRVVCRESFPLPEFRLGNRSGPAAAASGKSRRLSARDSRNPRSTAQRGLKQVRAGYHRDYEPNLAAIRK